MTQKYIAYYETLGLTLDASPEEIKKAYFRLVRKHSPEKDPEQFQKIREAYEALKDGPPAEQDGFPLPDDPEALFYLNEGERWYQEADYAYAAKQFLKALDAVPDQPHILWRLSTALMDNENWQKAAKYLEQLARLFPENREVFSMIANAYHRRGWHKKALPAFERAYELGEKDCKFLNGFASARKANLENQAAARLYWEAIEHYKPENADLAYAFDAFYGYSETADFFKSAALNYLDTYAGFIKKYKRQINDAEEATVPIYFLIKNHPVILKDREVFTKTCSVLDQAAGYGKEWAQYTFILGSILLQTALENDPRSLHQDWLLFSRTMPKEKTDDAKLMRYAKLDNMLCIIEDWEQLKTEYAIIRSDYPTLLRGYEEDFDRLAAGEGEALFDKLKWEFDKLAAKYEGSEYQKRHPEPKEKILYTTDGFDSTPYVRSGEKVGRNDPCPCGSGKKFKKCCMGKGIYD